jgi:hypothetical protein
MVRGCDAWSSFVGTTLQRARARPRRGRSCADDGSRRCSTERGAPQIGAAHGPFRARLVAAPQLGPVRRLLGRRTGPTRRRHPADPCHLLAGRGADAGVAPLDGRSRAGRRVVPGHLRSLVPADRSSARTHPSTRHDPERHGERRGQRRAARWSGRPRAQPADDEGLGDRGARLHRLRAADQPLGDRLQAAAARPGRPRARAVRRDRRTTGACRRAGRRDRLRPSRGRGRDSRGEPTRRHGHRQRLRHVRAGVPAAGASRTRRQHRRHTPRHPP